MNRMNPGSKARIALIAIAMLTLAMAVFFIFGFVATGLYRLFDGSFFAPENLLAWQIPALRGITPSDVQAPQAPAAPAPPAQSGENDAPQKHDAPKPSPQQSQVEIVEINPTVSEEVRIEILNMKDEKLPSIDLSGEAPRVLIYSTHSSEAYTQTDENKYKPSEEWRTHDETKNIIAVGASLAKELREKYGVAVIHDTTNHEPPDFYTSYNRSLETMKKYKEKYPSIDVFIDVHRDASEKKGENTDYVEIDGKRVARLMFVVGTGQGVTGVGWKERPEYKQNYKFALNITEELNEICASLGKPVRVNSARYNQHMSSRAMLVEVGHNKNTLEEALNAMPYLAKAIAAATGQEKE